MTLTKLLTSCAVTLTCGLVAAGAQAIAITDVTFRILPGDYQYADAAIQVSGNDSVAGVNALGGDFAGDPWFRLDKTDDSANSFMGVTFNISASIDATSGNWTLSWADTGEPGLPLSMDFLFVTKAANDWGAYLFQGFTFTSDPTSGDGTFEIPWTNRGGKTPGLSHASIYGREGDGDSPPPPPPPPPGVPVPGTLALFGLALLPLGWHLNRRPPVSKIA